jgi:hypothetical protein
MENKDKNNNQNDQNDQNDENKELIQRCVFLSSLLGMGCITCIFGSLFLLTPPIVVALIAHFEFNEDYELYFILSFGVYMALLLLVSFVILACISICYIFNCFESNEEVKNEPEVKK